MIFEFRDVLGRVVEERRPRIVLHGPLRPRRLEHLVGPAPQLGCFRAVAAGRSARIQRVPGGVMNVAVDALARPPGGERPSVVRSALAAAVVGGAAAAITYHLLRRSGGKTEAE
jgi:hypothetical protein